MRILFLVFSISFATLLFGQRLTLGVYPKIELDFRFSQNDYIGGFYDYMGGFYSFLGELYFYKLLRIRPVGYYGFNYRHILPNQITYVGTNLGFMYSTDQKYLFHNNPIKKIGGSIYWGLQSISMKNRFMPFMEFHLGYMPDNIFSSLAKEIGDLAFFPYSVTNNTSNFTFLTMKIGFRFGIRVRH